MKPITEAAYAKINLALHVRRRRDDGYHELETLFAFCDFGDILTLRSAKKSSFDISGEFAAGLTDGDDNLVARAIATLPFPDVLAAHLIKYLPVSSGLGGGSADAGAIFRIAKQLNILPKDWHTHALALGADVPACVESAPCIGRGIGADLVPVEDDIKGGAVLLVNPRIPLSTAAVFKAWDGVDRGAMTVGSARYIAEHGRNDLRMPAIALCPEIAHILALLSDSAAWKVDMSGSGATCFALFENIESRDQAASNIALIRPEWWQMSGLLHCPVKAIA